MINYNPLWHLCIERGIKKTALKEAIGVSPVTLAKLSKNEYVSLEVIERICKYLNCNIEDVVKIDI